MEELVFFGLIILFSIAESIARSRKAKAQRESGESTEPEQFEWAQKAPWEPELPTYDDDPSYDDAAEAATERPSGADSVADIWAEIADLAAGTRKSTGAATRPGAGQSPPIEPPSTTGRDDRSGSAPERSPPSLEERARAERAERAEVASRRLPVPVSGTRLPVSSTRAPVRAEQHVVHRSHLGFGTDPSSRVPSEQDGLDPLAEFMGADVAAVHAQLRSRSASALRQAIILKEVLGPPITLRDE